MLGGYYVHIVLPGLSGGAATGPFEHLPEHVLHIIGEAFKLRESRVELQNITSYLV